MKEILALLAKSIEELASSVDSLELTLVSRGYLAQGESNTFLATAKQTAHGQMAVVRGLIHALPNDKQ